MDATTEPSTALAPFRHRDFTIYQAARVILILAGQLVIVGLQLQILQLTNSAFHLGMIGLAQVLPNLLASLPAGHVADRVNRRTIIMTCALANAAAVGWLAWEAAQPHPSLVAIYIACGVFGLIRAFSAPAGHAFLPALVPESILNRAIVIHLTVFNLATVVGPAGGGFLYGERNALRVYGTAAAMFVVAYLLFALLRTRPAPTPGAEPFERAFTAGVRYVWNDKRLLGAMSLDLFAVLLGGATALLPVVAQNILHAGPPEYGFLRSAGAIGAGVAAIVLATRPLRSRIGSWLMYGVAVYGLATIGFGLSTSFPLSMALLIIAGAADMLSVTVRHTLIQVTTPDAMRGRVSAVSMIFINTSNEMGEFRAGTMAHYVGTARAILLGGVGTVVVVLAWMGLFPSLRKADRFEDKAR
ncbi:MAG: MFS transporter [Planctomycetota bacterium]|nr:MAG: MFS transporter [Planctomycetota bacterium]